MIMCEVKTAYYLSEFVQTGEYHFRHRRVDNHKEECMISLQYSKHPQPFRMAFEQELQELNKTIRLLIFQVQKYIVL